MQGATRQSAGTPQHALRANDVIADLARSAKCVREQQFGEVAFDLRTALPTACAHHVELVELREDVQFGESLTNNGIVDAAGGTGQRAELCDRVRADRTCAGTSTRYDEIACPTRQVSGDGARKCDAEAAAPTTSDAGAFEHERGVGHRPAVVEPADDVCHRHSGVVDEHLAEHRPAGHLAQRSNLDPRLMHVEREIRDALVLGCVGVGTRQQHAPIGVLASAGPHLLPGDDVLVAVEFGLGGEAGEV